MIRTTAHSPAAGRFRSGTRDDTADRPDRRTAKTADELLMEARASLPHRPSPAEAHAAQAAGAVLIDIRGDDQRRAGGLIPGAILLPRNALEWRCDPASRWRHPALAGRDQHLVLICQEGFQSSLAAATLQRLGLVNATDLDGGFAAWIAARLPVTRGRKRVTGARAVQPPAAVQRRALRSRRRARLAARTLYWQ
jgi:rhodanese-related sulfurtransferase